MKKALHVILWIMGVLALLLIIGFFLPKSAHISRSASINAPAATVYGVLTDLNTYDAWMPWNQIDTAMKKEFGPLTRGKGAWYSWSSENWRVGTGKLTITDVIPNQSVSTSLEFGGSDEANMASWELDTTGAATNITWNMHAQFGNNPFNRWFGLFFDAMLGPEFEKGLTQLKEKIESGSLKVASVTWTIEEISTPAFKVLTIMDTALVMADIGPVLQKAYGELSLMVQQAQLSTTGMPLSWYYTTSDPYVLEAAIPVNKAPVSTTGRIKWKEVPAGKAVVVHFYGPYEETEIAYTEINKWLAANKKTAKGAPYDVYVDDPAEKKSPYEVKTDIIQPIE